MAVFVRGINRSAWRRKQISFWVLGLLIHFDHICCMTAVWPNHGGGILNHRSSLGSRLTSESISDLILKWSFSTGFDVTATPSISSDTIFFPGWNGQLYALDRETGNVRWAKNLTDMMGVTTVSRATPLIAGNLLLVGLLGPAVVIALDVTSGDLVWQTRALDEEPQTLVTMSGTVYDGAYFVGISSNQEFQSCCSFQGSFVKIKLNNGEVLWQTYMLPPNSGYFGVSVWGSSPAIDVERRLVYIGTGNNYQVPECAETLEKPCQSPENRADSIVALNVDNGSIVWQRRLEANDVWTYTCARVNPNATNCPAALGKDFDFGEAPMLVYSSAGHDSGIRWRCMAITGQKSGVVWALDCDTGDVIWSTAAGPGSSLGGPTWGSCTDGERVYTNIGNFQHKNFTLKPTKNVTMGGGWVALNVSDGEVLWSTANPSGSAPAFGPVSVANGVVIAGSFNPTGEVYALNASTGSILWHYSTGRPLYGGFSITNDCFYGGNGYTHNGLSTQLGLAVFAFCLPTISASSKSLDLNQHTYNMM